MLDAADLYQSLIMDRARAPRHAGRPADFDAEAEGTNPMCGDRVRLWIKCDGEGRIAGLRHETKGCAICLASADLLGDAVLGKDRTDITGLNHDFSAMVETGCEPEAALGDLRALAGVHEYRSRIRCATLPWQALAAAMEKTVLESEVHDG